MEKKRPQLETRKLQMGKLTSKGKHTAKVGNYPHTIMISKPTIMRRGEYKCSILEMHSKLRDQYVCMYVCVCIYIYIYIYICIYIYTHIHIYIYTWLAVSKPHWNNKPKIYNRYTHRKGKVIQTQH